MSSAGPSSVGASRAPSGRNRAQTSESKVSDPDSAAMPRPDQSLDLRIPAGLLGPGIESHVLIMEGGKGGAGGPGGVHASGDGGSGGTGEGAKVYITAQNVTTLHPSPAVVQASQVLNHCPPPSRNFQGRQQILKKMHQLFAEKTGKQRIYVLYGLGGAGKTQIALKFIDGSTSFTDKFFVDMSSTETIETGLRAIAVAKGIGNSSQDALKWLATRDEQWLLFFDNADDPKINPNRCFPKCNHGNIIITTRNPSLRIYGAHSQISDMEESDAIALLLKSAMEENSIPNELLAADIVKAKLLSEKPTLSHDDYAWTAYTTWQMSFERLSPLAAKFLQLCSFLHQDGISEDIFGRAAYSLVQDQSEDKPKKLQKLKAKFKRLWSRSEISPKNNAENPHKFLSWFLGPNGEWDSASFVKVTKEIMAYSLINFDVERKSFSIHPLVHEWSRTTLADPDSYYSCMSDILGTSITEIYDEDLGLGSLQLVFHVDALIQTPRNEIGRFGLEYARIYRSVGRYTAAKQCEDAVLQNRRQVLGDDHLDTLQAMHNLAITYQDLGQLQEAEKLQVVVLEKRRKLLGDDHLDTLHAMNNLANTYRNLSLFQEAEKLQLVVLEKRRKLLGDDHLDTLLGMHNAAVTYWNLGQFQEAEKLQLVVLETRRKLLGDHHLDTLHAMNNLALTYGDLAQFQEAEKLQVVVLEKRRKLIGDDHLDTLLAMNNLAIIHHNLGRFQEAEKLQLVVLEKRRKLLGDDHLDTLLAMNNLAATYGNLGRFEEAEKLKLVVLEKRRKHLGDDHLRTLLAMNNLAATYGNLGRFSEAEKLEVVVLEKQRKLLGDNHPETLGQLENAEELQVVAVEKQRKLFGDNHPESQRYMRNLARTYRKLDKQTEAEELEKLLISNGRRGI
ncbi:hypothetical protein K438DRAFT_1945281 [Mycena galopus ATCC 62051]|nr:hypothetical protein K438DRAFT_1945281 [Mycena galopus ATCC 62051]